MLTTPPQPGQIVRARVTRVEHFGIFFDFDGWEVLVLIVDLGWTPTRSPVGIAGVGDLLDVLVVAQVGPGRLKGSIRDLHPEASPWREPGVYRPGTQHEVQTTTKTSYGTWARLPSGAEGVFPGQDLQIGQRLLARVMKLDVIGRRIELEPVGPTQA